MQPEAHVGGLLLYLTDGQVGNMHRVLQHVCALKRLLKEMIWGNEELDRDYITFAQYSLLLTVTHYFSVSHFKQKL